MKRRVVIMSVVLIGLPAAYVIEQAVTTLQTLTAVERERDTWQRPDAILQPLDLVPGRSVVDLGSGAGYFSLKMARRVGSSGRVLAVDVRSESLAFLRIRATLAGLTNLQIVHGTVDDPKLPPNAVDAVLIANTYHELESPDAILDKIFASMRSGGTLVVVDRAPREAEPDAVAAEHHEIAPDEAARAIGRRGFQVVTRDNRFIDQPGDELWWLAVFRKP